MNNQTTILNTTVKPIAHSVKGVSNEEFVNEALSNTSVRMQGNEGLFILIHVMISGIGGKYTIKNTKIYDGASGEELSGQEAVKNPSVQLLPTSSLNFQYQARDNIYALFRREGFNLGQNMFLLKHDKALMVYKELLAIQAKLTHETEEFYNKYPDIIAEQKILNPKLKDIIEQYVPKREKIKQQIRMKISAPQALAIHGGAMTEVEELLQQTGNADTTMTGSLLDQIVEGFCKDVTHFWNYSLRQIKNAVADPEKRKRFEDPKISNSGVAGVAIEILKNLKSKVEEVQLLQPGFFAIGEKLDSTVALLPDGYNTKATSIKDFAAMKKCLDVMTELKCTETVRNLVISYGESSDLYDQMQVEIAENAMADENAEINLDEMYAQSAGEGKAVVETTMDELLGGISTNGVQTEPDQLSVADLELTDAPEVVTGPTEEEQQAIQEEDFNNLADAFAEALGVTLDIEEDKVPAFADELSEDEKAFLESDSKSEEQLSMLAQTSVSSYAREAEIIDEQPVLDEQQASDDAQKEPEQAPEPIAAFGAKAIEINDLFNGLF
ncbi:DUF3150 domain-containing protein [Vibrio rotiferianus]